MGGIGIDGGADTFESARGWYDRSRPWIWPTVGFLWAALAVAVEGSTPWQIICAALGGLAIALRVSRPGASLLTSWVLAFAMMFGAKNVMLFPSMAIMMSLEGATRYGGRATWTASWLSVPVGATIAAFYTTYWGTSIASGLIRPERTPTAVVIAFGTFLAVLGAAWLIGQLGKSRDRSRQRKIDAVLARQQTREEKERANVARDMHDVLAHSLSVIVALADGSRMANKDLPPAVSESLSNISKVGRDALAEVRGLLSRLRSPDEDASDPDLTIEGIIADARLAGLEITVEATSLSRDTASSTYRTMTLVLREALTNALRHGDVTQPVEVHLDWDSATIEVRNQCLPQAQPTLALSGLGLIGMRERVELSGGTFRAARDGNQWVLMSQLQGGPA